MKMPPFKLQNALVSRAMTSCRNYCIVLIWRLDNLYLKLDLYNAIKPKKIIIEYEHNDETHWKPIEQIWILTVNRLIT